MLRGVGKALGGFIFVLSLTSLFGVFVFTEITDYDNARSFVTNLISTEFEDEMPEDMSLSMVYDETKKECQGKESISSGLFEGSIDCSDFSEIGADEFPEYISGLVFDNFYYAEYDCGFIECVKEQPQFLFSAKGNEVFKSLMNYLIIATIFGAALIIVSCKSWSDRFRTFGWTLFFIGLGYFFINLTKKMMLGPEEIESIVGPMISSVFDTISNYYLISLILGIILIIVGYLLKKKDLKKVKK
jgi:hypothetical protein